jgi:hypothetical protein
MSEVIALSTSRMRDSDLRAIAIYLKDQKGDAQTADATATPDDKTMKAGAAIYADQC